MTGVDACAILGEVERSASCTSVPSDSLPEPRRARLAHRAVAGVVAAIEFVIGMAAVFGGYGLLSDAEGLGAKQAWLDGTIFPDYTVPGLFLLVVIGGGMLCAAVLTVVAERYARVAAGVMANAARTLGRDRDGHDRLARMAAGRARGGVRRGARAGARPLCRARAEPPAGHVSGRRRGSGPCKL